MYPPLDQLKDLLKKTAAEELLPRFATSEQTVKADGSIVTAADLAMQERLTFCLRELWPDYGLLGEEMSAQQQAKAVAREERGLWCLDPLDGTSNFAAGIPFFAVSLALLVDKRPVLGIVYDPVRDECFTAESGQGAWLNGEKLTAPATEFPLKRCIGVIDFKRLKYDLANKLVRSPPYRSQRNFGAVALEWCWLAAGRFHLYLHGKQKVWDYAAGALILAEAGGCAATLAGGAVLDGSLKSHSVLAAMNPYLFEKWRKKIS